MKPTLSRCLRSLNSMLPLACGVVLGLVSLLAPVPAHAATLKDHARSVEESLGNAAQDTADALRHRDPRQLSFDAIASWVVVGLLVGSVAGWITTRRRAGYGLWLNGLVGVVSVFLGGVIVDSLKISFRWGELRVRHEETLAAFLVSLALVLAVRCLAKLWSQRGSTRKTAPARKE